MCRCEAGAGKISQIPVGVGRVQILMVRGGTKNFNSRRTLAARELIHLV